MKWSQKNLEKELEITGKNYWDTIAEVTNSDHIKLIFNNNELMEPPINKILFGPPGTVKHIIYPNYFLNIQTLMRR